VYIYLHLLAVLVNLFILLLTIPPMLAFFKKKLTLWLFSAYYKASRVRSLKSTTKQTAAFERAEEEKIMAKILSFVDHQQKIREDESQRRPPEDFIKMNFEVNIFRPTVWNIKNRNLTRYQARRLYAILCHAFGIKYWETEPNNNLLLEYEWGLTKSSFLPTYFEKGDLLIHEIISWIQQETFPRLGAIHILQVARLWYKEVLQ
jgi:hypothetical protein